MQNAVQNAEMLARHVVTWAFTFLPPSCGRLLHSCLPGQDHRTAQSGLLWKQTKLAWISCLRQTEKRTATERFLGKNSSTRPTHVVNACEAGRAAAGLANGHLATYRKVVAAPCHLKTDASLGASAAERIWMLQDGIHWTIGRCHQLSTKPLCGMSPLLPWQANGCKSAWVQLLSGTKGGLLCGEVPGPHWDPVSQHPLQVDAARPRLVPAASSGCQAHPARKTSLSRGPASALQAPRAVRVLLQHLRAAPPFIMGFMGCKRKSTKV